MTEGNNSEDKGKTEELDTSFANGSTTCSSEESFEDREVDLNEADSAEFKLGETEAELAKVKQDYLRSLADLENIKKRHMKERSQLLKYQGERLVVDLIDVVDNFDLAMASEVVDPAGIQMIHAQLNAVLEKWQVAPKPTVGTPFNPEYQEALSMQPDPDSEPGTVLNELKKAYYYKDRLVRPGQVIVSKKAEESIEENEENTEE